MSPTKPPRKRPAPPTPAAAPLATPPTMSQAKAPPKPAAKSQTHSAANSPAKSAAKPIAAAARVKAPVAAAPKVKPVAVATPAPVPAGEQWDLLVRDVRVVRPGKSGAALADIAVRAGKIVRVGRGLPVEHAKRIHDGQGLLAFPGLVDANVHLGVYATLEEDAASESRAMAQGGITTSL